MIQSSETDPSVLLTIVGRRVALGPLRRDLLPLYQRWMNDFEVTRNLAVGSRPLTLEAEEDWYAHASRSSTDALFTLYERPNLRPIGTASLHRIDHQHRTAEFGIVIGERDCWGRGYGTETTARSLEYAFNVLGLHAVHLRVYSGNERGLRAYTRAGFKVAGRLREAHRYGAEVQDVILMDCLSTEFDRSILGGSAGDAGTR